MKTKLRKLIALTLLSLTLTTTLLQPLKADVFQEEVTYFCTVAVINASGGVTEAIGIGTDCRPAFNWWCKPKKCLAITLPQK